MASLSGWIDGVLFTILFIVILSGVVGGLNTLYSKSFEMGLGTDTTTGNIENYQTQLQEKIEGGDIDFSAETGISLSSSWDMIKSTLSVLWNFITGGMIETICTDWLMLPKQVGGTLRILFFLAVTFLAIALLFKRKI